MIGPINHLNCLGLRQTFFHSEIPTFVCKLRKKFRLATNSSAISHLFPIRRRSIDARYCQHESCQVCYEFQTGEIFNVIVSN